jgi:hypothetical protein
MSEYGGDNEGLITILSEIHFVFCKIKLSASVLKYEIKFHEL